jgi:predicted metal-dependent phosphoesterase TrpH
MSRADLHCHSAASEVSKLGVQREVGLPECATPPAEVHALAKRRGMDFVTITDHDTIAGVLDIADRPDVFISEELTARFRGEPHAVHVLCLGITPGVLPRLDRRGPEPARGRRRARGRRLRPAARLLARPRRGRGVAHGAGARAAGRRLSYHTELAYTALAAATRCSRRG